MHDKVVRRRRAVLALLVAVSLILLTAYFGESPSSPLHSIQRGIVAVISPVEAGASKVLSPVRDVASWVSDTLRAKSKADRLQRQVDTLTAEVDQYKTQQVQNVQLTRQLHLDTNVGLANDRLVSANVIVRDPSAWYQTITVDAGSGQGVAQGDPVTGDGALVGEVTTVTSSASVVTLITDHSISVGAEVLDGGNYQGLVSPSVGSPNQLLMQDIPGTAQVRAGDPVVTSGWRSPSGSFSSLYPAGIPIGNVAPFSQSQLYNSNEVPVTLTADLRHLDAVQILTAPQAGNARAQVP
ncbi:MAG: rod shape-determining protein MreC [Solirubrobacteraceae bacterium]